MVRKGLKNMPLSRDELVMLRQVASTPEPAPAPVPVKRRPGKLHNKMITPRDMSRALEKEQVMKSGTNDHMTNVPCPPLPRHPPPCFEEDDENVFVLPSGIVPPPGLFPPPSFAPPPGLPPPGLSIPGEENTIERVKGVHLARDDEERKCPYDTVPMYHAVFKDTDLGWNTGPFRRS